MKVPFKNLIAEIQDLYYETESEESLESILGNKIKNFSHNYFLYNLCVLMKSNLCKDIVFEMPKLVSEVSFEDLKDVLSKMESDELAIYYYAQILAVVFGIDVHALTPNDGIALLARAYISKSFRRGAFKPDEWTEKRLDKYGLSQTDVIKKMQEQGAPIIAS